MYEIGQIALKTGQWSYNVNFSIYMVKKSWKWMFLVDSDINTKIACVL